ncbi:AEC family transporter [Nitriliruptoraceae bacterium ZYF776]|nr:AEC family transporter [Profundirhabdus halotolerans]
MLRDRASVVTRWSGSQQLHGSPCCGHVTAQRSGRPPARRYRPAVLTVLVLLLLGVALGQLRLLPDGAGSLLDTIVVRVALPGLILAVVPELEVGAEALVPVAAAWGSLALLAGAVWVLGRVADLDRRTLGTLLLVVPLANTGFLGYPAVEALLGTDHLADAIVYDQLGTFLALSTYAAVVAGRFGARATPTAGEMVRRVVTFPPFVALLVGGVALVAGGLPAPVAEVADRVGDTVTPLAMLAVGVRLRLQGDAWRPALLGGGLALRLVVAPAVVVAVALAVGGEGTAWTTSALQSGMPPMVLAGVMAAQAELDGELAARFVGVGVLASMVTLPAWAAVLERLL